MEDVKWVATLSDGTTAVEHSEDWKIIEGQRKPWVRLCQFAAEEGLHLTSLRLNFRGRTIHMPRMAFDRFDMNEQSLAPKFYSLQYHIEGEFLDNGGFSQVDFVDLAAHYDGYVVHYIQDVSDGNTSWVVVTDESREALAPTPRKQE
jgi:hypothetical protein